MTEPQEITPPPGARLGTAPGLLALFIASFLLRSFLGHWVPAPDIFDDEWAHWETARSLAGGEGMAWSGRPINFPCWAYPLLLSLPARIQAPFAAHHAAQILNAAIASLMPLMAFGFARAMGADRARAFAAAGLSGLLPALGYTPLLMAENLYYPAFMLALWAILRAMGRPSLLRCALAGAACGLAFHAKPQGFYLPAIYIGAVIADQGLEIRAKGSSAAAWRAAALGVLRHAPAAAGWALALAPRLVILARDPHIANPYTLDAFLGRYGGLASGEFVVVSRGVMAKMALSYAAFAAIGVGFLPFAAPLPGFRRDSPREFRQGALLAGIALAVLIACSVWLIGGRRVHERFTAAAYPALLACFCARPSGDRGQARPVRGWAAALAALMATYVAFRAGRIMDWFLAGDAPSGVWMLFFFHHPIVPPWAWVFFGLSLLEAAVPGALLLRGKADETQRRITETLFVALMLVSLCVGWYAGHAGLSGKESDFARRSGRQIAERIAPGERLLIVADRLDPRVLRHAAFFNRGAVVARVLPHNAWFAYPLKVDEIGWLVDPLGGQPDWVLVNYRPILGFDLATDKWRLYRHKIVVFEGPTSASSDANANQDR